MENKELTVVNNDLYNIVHMPITYNPAGQRSERNTYHRMCKDNVSNLTRSKSEITDQQQNLFELVLWLWAWTQVST